MEGSRGSREDFLSSPGDGSFFHDSRKLTFIKSFSKEKIFQGRKAQTIQEGKESQFVAFRRFGELFFCLRRSIFESFFLSALAISSFLLFQKFFCEISGAEEYIKMNTYKREQIRLSFFKRRRV